MPLTHFCRLETKLNINENPIELPLEGRALRTEGNISDLGTELGCEKVKIKEYCGWGPSLAGVNVNYIGLELHCRLKVSLLF